MTACPKCGEPHYPAEPKCSCRLMANPAEGAASGLGRAISNATLGNQNLSAQGLLAGLRTSDARPCVSCGILYCQAPECLRSGDLQPEDWKEAYLALLAKVRDAVDYQHEKVCEDEFERQRSEAAKDSERIESENYTGRDSADAQPELDSPNFTTRPNCVDCGVSVRVAALLGDRCYSPERCAERRRERDQISGDNGATGPKPEALPSLDTPPARGPEEAGTTQEDRTCGALSRDGTYACVLDWDHDGGHAWTTPNARPVHGCTHEPPCLTAKTCAHMLESGPNAGPARRPK